MAAYTTFSHDALARYLIMFDIGELVSFTETETGIENSNYFLQIKKYDDPDDYVLSLMESLSFDDLPFFNNLTTHLSNYGLPVASPRRTLDGMITTIFRGKPTLLYDRLPGEHVVNVTTAHCEAIGAMLGEMHDAVSDGKLERANPYDHEWLAASLDSIDTLNEADRRLCLDLVDDYAGLDGSGLAQGIIHGDLFIDNALFAGDELTGVIDFYHACDDYFVEDLAIAANDWCRAEGRIDPARQLAIQAGYASQRTLTAAEEDALPLFMQIGALRFFLTRSQDPSGAKDPIEFLELLRQLRG